MSRKKSKKTRAATASWQVQTAKAKFSEVFRRARTEGPQSITRQGREAVVMISDELCIRLIKKSDQASTLVEFFRRSPLVGIELDLDRQRDEGRHID